MTSGSSVQPQVRAEILGLEPDFVRRLAEVPVDDESPRKKEKRKEPTTDKQKLKTKRVKRDSDSSDESEIEIDWDKDEDGERKIEEIEPLPNHLQPSLDVWNLICSFLPCSFASRMRRVNRNFNVAFGSILEQKLNRLIVGGLRNLMKKREIVKYLEKMRETSKKEWCFVRAKFQAQMPWDPLVFLVEQQRHSSLVFYRTKKMISFSHLWRRDHWSFFP